MDYQRRIAWAVIGIVAAGAAAMWMLFSGSTLGGPSSSAEETNAVPERSHAHEPHSAAPVVMTEGQKKARAEEGLERAERSFNDRAVRLRDHYPAANDAADARADELRAATAKFTFADSLDQREREISERGAILQGKLKGQMRALFASTTEESFIRRGMDARVTAGGAEQATLQLNYVLMSRPLVYQITNESPIRQEARSLGFKRIVFTNNVSGSPSESWTVDL
ncbi:hypothetical protein JY430_13115 [Stenotrophomonas maltophilia]|nr:hypothetical protein [Stenotrophomonas maltophilia]